MKNVNCNNMTTDKKDCAFEQNKQLFTWYETLGKEDKIFVMPCLKNTSIRVNFCPTCGANVRNANLKL